MCSTTSHKMKAANSKLTPPFVPPQSDDLAEVERRLKLLGIEYVRRTVVEDSIEVEQLFFHDPDGFMIEVCNCENIPLVPLPRCSRPRRLSASQKRMKVNCDLIDSEDRASPRPSPRLLMSADAVCRDSPRLSSQHVLSGFDTGVHPVVLHGIAT